MYIQQLIELKERSEVYSQQAAEKFIEEVNENRYPVIEMRDTVVRKVWNKRFSDSEQQDGDNGVFITSDFDFDVVSNEFVVVLTKCQSPIEYIHVLMREENGKSVIDRFDVISRHRLNDPMGYELNDKAEYLISVSPTFDKDDYNSVNTGVTNYFITLCEKLGIGLSDEDENSFHDYAALWLIKTVFALSYISEKYRNQTVYVREVPNSKKVSLQPHNTSSNFTSSNVVEIGDFKIIYPNKGNGDRTYTRHIESWTVRGHIRHYKSGKVAYIKPFVKGDRSVPVQNKVYQVS